jgi:L-ascorbate metabolism protein UlaG (beta-lactamase superfamily)
MRALLPPVMGTLLEVERADAPGRPADRPFRLYVTGDTLCVEELRTIRELYPQLDAMVIHLGGTRVLGALVTMDADQGCELIDLLSPDRVVPVHYDDYGAFKSGLDEFAAQARRRGWSDRVSYLARGETVALPAG